MRDVEALNSLTRRTIRHEHNIDGDLVAVRTAHATGGDNAEQKAERERG